MATPAVNPIGLLVQEAIDLKAEIVSGRKSGLSNKDLIAFVQRKDGIVGGGQHHRTRQVTAGQIIGDLDAFIGKFGTV